MKNSRVSPQEAAKELLSRRSARSSFAGYCRYVAPDEPPAKHHLLITDAGDQIVAGKLKRVMFLMPPGSAKSTYATVRFPAYFLGKLGAKGVITASYGDELATRFGQKVRNLVRSAGNQRLFPATRLTADSQAKGEWETEQGGFYFATGVGGGVTGRRADLGVIDDPFKGRQDADSEVIREKTWNWYIDDFRTRLKPGAAILLIQTRWHMDDLAGRILPEDWAGESGWITARDGEQWLVICLPAEARAGDILGRAPGEWLWTAYFDEAFWAQTKKTAMLHDVRTWNSLYQQVPADLEGTFFQRSWFDNRYDVPPKHINRYMSGDFATTDGGGDYTELAAWGLATDEYLYALDWFGGQVTSDVWTDELLAMADTHAALRFIGETGPIRNSVEPWLNKRMRETGKYVACDWLTPMSKESDSVNGKAAGARAFQAMARMGRVRFPRTAWAERVIDQLCKFPAGTIDDCVDTCALIGRFVASMWAAVEPEKPAAALEQQWHAPMRMSDLMEPIGADSTW